MVAGLRLRSGESIRSAAAVMHHARDAAPVDVRICTWAEVVAVRRLRTWRRSRSGDGNANGVEFTLGWAAVAYGAVEGARRLQLSTLLPSVAH